MSPPDPNILRTAAGVARGTSDVPPELLRLALADPERLLWQHADRPVKISHDSLIVRARLTLCGGPVEMVYKQYRPRNAWKAFLGLFRRSRALANWRLAEILAAQGVPTARPILACQPSGRRGATSYLAMEWIDGAENLHLYGWRLVGQAGPVEEMGTGTLHGGNSPAFSGHKESVSISPQPLRRAAQAAESLGRLLGRMHAGGIAHRDLKGANLLLAPRGDRVDAYLIDLDGMRRPRRLTEAVRVANLSRLAVSMTAHPWVPRTAWCRFFRAYVAEFGPGAVDWKSLWRAVVRQSRQMIARRQRRGEEML